jgi:hypothetical protein
MARVLLALCLTWCQCVYVFISNHGDKSLAGFVELSKLPETGPRDEH